MNEGFPPKVVPLLLLPKPVDCPAPPNPGLGAACPNIEPPVFPPKGEAGAPNPPPLLPPPKGEDGACAANPGLVSANAPNEGAEAFAKPLKPPPPPVEPPNAVELPNPGLEPNPAGLLAPPNMLEPPPNAGAPAKEGDPPKPLLPAWLADTPKPPEATP